MSDTSFSSDDSVSHSQDASHSQALIAELRSAQDKRKELIEKTKVSMGKQKPNTSSPMPTSRNNSKLDDSKDDNNNPSNKQLSRDPRDIRRNSELRRSKSLLALRSIAPSTAEAVAKNHKRYYTNKKARKGSLTVSQDSDTEFTKSEISSDLETVNTFPLMSSTKSKSKSKQKYRHQSKNNHERRHSRQLRKAVDRLNMVLTKMHETKQKSRSQTRKSPRSPRNDVSLKQNPDLGEEAPIDEIASTIDILTERLQNDVTSFIFVTTKEKDCLNELRKDNARLNLKLQKAIQAQTTLEAKLSLLSKEKSLLDMENKNLAMQIVPLQLQSAKLHKEENSGRTDENKNISAGSMPSTSMEDNHIHNRQSRRKSKGASNLFGIRSRWSSRQRRDAGPIPSTTISKTSVVTGSGTEDEDDNDDDAATTVSVENPASISPSHRQYRDELDSITTYVKKKKEDFGKLEGELYKYQEKARLLQEKITFLTQEHQTTLTEFGEIVDSYRELEEERDNYECILKLILKEKSSSESNLHQLLDDLVKQLNSSSKNNNSQDNIEETSEVISNQGSTMVTTSYSRYSSKDFLQSVLQVLQGQNITLREEMAKLKETLNETNGQNELLKGNNETLIEKVQELKKTLEGKDQEVEEEIKGLKVKFESLDKLHQTILTTKNQMEEELAEKEKEFLRIQNLADSLKKENAGQNKEIVDLRSRNDKLEKEAKMHKDEVENLNQAVVNLKTCLRDESGIWCDRLNNASHDLSHAKEQCKWLQSQIDKLNVQLLDAHRRIRMHEQDKSVLAQQLISANEKIKTMDRKILEIKSIMEGDSVYREALAERNEVLQLKINRLRKKSYRSEFEDMDASESDSSSILKSTQPQIDTTGKSENNQEITKYENFKADQDQAIKAVANDRKSLLTAPPTEKFKKDRKFHNTEVGDANVSPSPLSRKHLPHSSRRQRHQRGTSCRRPFTEAPPRAAISLHAPEVLCYRGGK